MADPHWFEALADHMGPAYLRYSFTKGTVQEIDALIEMLGLGPDSRVLDVGCGPGRHSLELARRGIETVGVDISARFVELATNSAADAGVPATFVRGDARRLDQLDLGGNFSAAISLCQGAIGLADASPAAEDPRNLSSDAEVLRGMALALRPGGRLAVSAFSAYFQVRHLMDGNEFNPESGVHHEFTEVRDPEGLVLPSQLWTTCVTPRELHLQANRCGIEVDGIWSVTPGAYGRHPITIDSEEFLLVGRVGP